MKRYPYQSVPVRKELIKRIHRVLSLGVGYRSITEFVNEAVRLRLEQVETLLLRAAAMGPGGGGCGAAGPDRGDEPRASDRGR